MKKLYLIPLVTAILFSACKKYKEGPLISFRSVEKRITGTWQITEFTGNGIDSLQYYNDSCGANVNIKKREVDSDEYDMLFKGGQKNIYGRFHFENFDKIRVLFRSHENGNFRFMGPIISDIESYWEVLRLKKNELKISVDFNNISYKISFKRI